MQLDNLHLFNELSSILQCQDSHSFSHSLYHILDFAIFECDVTQNKASRLCKLEEHAFIRSYNNIQSIEL